MSEYVVMHCLMHLRRQKQYDGQQREGRWYDERDQPAARDLRVGLLGLGVLGADAGRKLKVMGFDVAGWSRSRRPSRASAPIRGRASSARSSAGRTSSSASCR
jgi:glyoxylate/hydroxypyruvate reductase A